MAEKIRTALSSFLIDTTIRSYLILNKLKLYKLQKQIKF